MKSYCLKCSKDTENINPRVSSTSNGKAMILSKCAIYGSMNEKSEMNEIVNKFLLAGDKFMP